MSGHRDRVVVLRQDWAAQAGQAGVCRKHGSFAAEAQAGSAGPRKMQLFAALLAQMEMLTRTRAHVHWTAQMNSQMHRHTGMPLPAGTHALVLLCGCGHQ